MPGTEIIEQLKKYVHPFRVAYGKDFDLKHFSPADTCGLKIDKSEAAELLQGGSEWLATEQDMLYAQDRWSLLLIFQAMDAAGKDGTIKHVMSGVNPQGCQVYSFKPPSAEELNHDFLWRYATRAPERGRIGIFNRSYYEEVLVVRVHDVVADQRCGIHDVGAGAFAGLRADDLCAAGRRALAGSAGRCTCSHDLSLLKMVCRGAALDATQATEAGAGRSDQTGEMPRIRTDPRQEDSVIRRRACKSARV